MLINLTKITTMTPRELNCESVVRLVILTLQVAEEIWICENGTVTKWEGGILKYKDHLKANILKENAATAAAKVRK